MDWWEALILGIVEGLTEYLPVSSTGHLLVVQRLLGIESSEVSDAFAISVQLGAIVAVLGLYRARVAQMVKGVFGKDADGLKLAVNIVAAFIPAAILGLLLEKPIKENLFGGGQWGLWPIVIAWLIGGVAILAVAFYKRSHGGGEQTGNDLLQLTWQLAVVIGVAQCIAMWPGVSRSLITIVGGMLVGLRLPAAVEFSFLLGVVTLGAATSLDLLRHGAEMLEHYGVVALGIGFLAAWVSAVLAVKWMVGYLNKHGMEIFGYYRIAIALLVGAWILLGTGG